MSILSCRIASTVLIGGAPLVGDIGGTAGGTGEQVVTSAGVNRGYDPIYDIHISPDFWQLVLAIVIFVFASVLMVESAKIQKWAFSNDDVAPNAFSGIGYVAFTTLLIFLVWFVNLAVQFPPGHSLKDDGGWGNFILTLFFEHPRETAIGVCLGSLLPSALASYKFLVVVKFSRSAEASAANGMNSGPSAFIGALFSFINLAGSCATLCGFLTNWQAWQLWSHAAQH